MESNKEELDIRKHSKDSVVMTAQEISDNLSFLYNGAKVTPEYWLKFTREELIQRLKHAERLKKYLDYLKSTNTSPEIAEKVYSNIKDLTYDDAWIPSNSPEEIAYVQAEYDALVEEVKDCFLERDPKSIKFPGVFRAYRFTFSNGKSVNFYAEDILKYADENGELDYTFEIGPDSEAELNEFDRMTMEGIVVYDMYDGGKPYFIFGRAMSFTKNKEIDDKIWKLIEEAKEKLYETKN